jgi:hypothetical protein
MPSIQQRNGQHLLCRAFMARMSKPSLLPLWAAAAPVLAERFNTKTLKVVRYFTNRQKRWHMSRCGALERFDHCTFFCQPWQNKGVR